MKADAAMCFNDGLKITEKNDDDDGVRCFDKAIIEYKRRNTGDNNNNNNNTPLTRIITHEKNSQCEAKIYSKTTD